MEIHLLAIGTRMPGWVDEGFNEYSRRLGRDCEIVLKALPSPRKSKTENSAKVKQQEGELLLAAIPPDAYAVALHEHGKMLDTVAISQKLGDWFEQYRRVALIVGGADGLSEECLAACKERWSLSRMTFPHSLVRVIVAEQIYRAYSLLHNHPYHRA